MALAVLEVPVPVGLHPGLVDSELFPVFVARGQVVGNPVEFLALRVATLGQRWGYVLPILVAAVDVDIIGEVDLFGSNVEAVEFHIPAVQAGKTAANLIHVPVKGLEPVFDLCKVEAVAPVDGRGVLVGEPLEHDGVGQADYNFALSRRIADSSGGLGAGGFQRSDSAVFTQPEVQLMLPFRFCGRKAGGGDDKVPACLAVLPFEEDEGLEQPVFAAVGGRPANVGPETLCIPSVGFAVGVTYEVGVAQRFGCVGRRVTAQTQQG